MSERVLDMLRPPFSRHYKQKVQLEHPCAARLLHLQLYYQLFFGTASVVPTCSDLSVHVADDTACRCCCAGRFRGGQGAWHLNLERKAHVPVISYV